MPREHFEITPSSGNVFEDLGFKDAKQRLAKAELVSRINDVIDARGFNQTETGKILGISQPKVSALINGKLEGFSMERLITFLMKLDQDVEIVIKDKPKNRRNHGQLHVAFA
jgi:predicted XRE-type DNA-binding protein